MKLDKDFQIAMLITLYLCRSGTSRLKVISKNLEIPFKDLVGPARALVKSGVLATNGAVLIGKTYELNGEPTVLDVFRSFEYTSFLTVKERAKYSIGGMEERSLFKLTNMMTFTLLPLMKMTVRDVGKKLVKDEMNALNMIGLSTLDN